MLSFSINLEVGGKTMKIHSLISFKCQWGTRNTSSQRWMKFGAGLHKCTRVKFTQNHMIYKLTETAKVESLMIFIQKLLKHSIRGFFSPQWNPSGILLTSEEISLHKKKEKKNTFDSLCSLSQLKMYNKKILPIIACKLYTQKFNF